MREIKFRAWDGKEMYHPMYQGGSWLGRWRIIGEAEHPVMQFTGLHDKNGKEMYEGDVCVVGNTKGVIEWDSGRASFFIKQVPDGLKSEHLYGAHLVCEVIGNIYENPDLLA